MNFWKDKRVLVTGAGGFIGSHLTEELIQRGANVKALVHYNSNNNWGLLEQLEPEVLKHIDVKSGDIRSSHYCNALLKDVDIVFHLAALIAIPYSYVAPEEFITTNIIGTSNILQASIGTNIQKIVHTSTSETYGTAQYTPIDEKHPLKAQSPYAASKIGADMIVESFVNSFNVPAATIRPFNNYGPRQSARAIIPTIISQIVAGKNEIKLGDLKPIRDLVFVKDTVQAFIAIAENKDTVGEVINIGTGHSVSIGELAQKIIDIMDAKVHVINDAQRYRPQKSEVFELVCDYNKSKEILNWSPKYTLDEGLKMTINYIEKNINLYKTDIFNL